MRLERFQVGDELVKLGRKLNLVVDYCKSITPKSGENTRVRQTHAGAYISADRSPQGGGGGGGGAAWAPYFFAVSIKDADEVSVAAGKVINGTTVSTISAADVSIGTTDGTYYLSIEIWYNSTWKSAYLKATTYPTQGTKSDSGTFPCLRALLAVVVVSGNVVSSVTQVWPGHEIVNPRVAD